ncbi:hypothetical protein ACFSB1_00420 [Halopseudomonas phragmitis]|uniref:Uncharacterized protein n=1 Tax=Halopseudomonas phragmitis TaxID=1931241 RepID=A0A1V0B6D0_9GAMM|nr:hypothetical protein [Halopseudomonas phragmitis]AQZ95450.1 hypothetical protein BVH74_12125 [Halopseudomonas phragmitis]
MQLFHGSYETISEIKNQGLFGGLFAADSEASALAHGDVLHVIEIEDSKALTQSVLSYELDHEAVMAALNEVAGHWCEDLDRLYELAIEEAQVKDADIELLKAEDWADAGWEAQRIRGQVAKALGFQAVEMSDEHGTTWLVMPGANIREA